MGSNSLVDRLKEYLDNMPEDTKKKLFQEEVIPKGWVEVKNHLPKFLVKDLPRGYSEYLVKDKDGNEFETRVSDHILWKYYAEQEGITHWFNE